MRLVDRCDVKDAVEHERAVEVDRPLEDDRRHLAAGGAEPAFAHGRNVEGGRCGRTVTRPAAAPSDQRFVDRSPHNPVPLAHGELAVTVTLRFPFESFESVNFTQAVLFVFDCSRKAPVGLVVETR